MGVAGLAPFIQKTCPGIIRTLPDRLRELSGKTVVIDGTLITQRLHFAPMPHRYRHILGWYRIIKELRECSVQAVCVFDGKERSSAKELEIERRRLVRRLTAARGALELERLERLRKLAGILQMWRKLGRSGQEQVSGTLPDLANQAGNTPSELLTIPAWVPAVEPWRTVRQPDVPKHIIWNSLRPDEVFGDLDSPDISEALRRDVVAAFVARYVSDAAEVTTPDEGTLGDHCQGMLLDDELHELAGVALEQDVSASYVDGAGLYADEVEVDEMGDFMENDTKADMEEQTGESMGEEADEGVEEETDENVEEDTIECVEDSVEDTVGKLAHCTLGKNDCNAMDESPSDSTVVPPMDANVQDIVSSSIGHVIVPTASLSIAEAQKPTDETQDNAGSSHGILDPPPNEIKSALVSLYFQYCQSVPKLAALPLTPSAPATPVVSEQEIVTIQDEERTVNAMSKRQSELAGDEGRLWNYLSDVNLSDLSTQTVEQQLAVLAEKSNVISESYERRTHPPTAETYMESKEILRAMGVPCIESTGPFEAEALASSLVLNGYADYVASEDTDVLVYEAPLIRNIANRNGPLVIISGTDVRATLQLDRAGFVDFALLLGTDFSQRIKNIGPARALRFIRAHGSIERVLERETQYQPRADLATYLAQVSLARTVFETLPPMPDATSLEPREYDEEEVMLILSKYHLHREAMEEFDHNSALSGNFFADNPVGI